SGRTTRHTNQPLRVKKHLLIGLVAVLLNATAPAATLVIDLFAGQLLKADASTPMPDGGLLQLVTSTTDNTFTAPTASSFTGASSDDMVVASYVMDHNSGGGFGDSLQQITLNYSGNFGAGDLLLLRWWPTLGGSATTPGAGTTYGQFRIDT